MKNKPNRQPNPEPPKSAHREPPKGAVNPPHRVAPKSASSDDLGAHRWVSRDRRYLVLANNYKEGQLLECSNSQTLAGAFGVIYDDFGEAKATASALLEFTASEPEMEGQMVYTVTTMAGDVLWVTE